eukprot:5479902-Pleurochrysis_carterae.AAC.2
MNRIGIGASCPSLPPAHYDWLCSYSLRAQLGRKGHLREGGVRPMGEENCYSEQCHYRCGLGAEGALSVAATQCRLGELQVLQSEPRGIELLHHHPDPADDPGLEEWFSPERWSRETQAFTDVQQRWAVPAGVVHRVGEGLRFGGAPALSWSQLWALLDSPAPGDANATTSGASAQQPAASAAEAQSLCAAPLRGNARHEHLSSSPKLSEVNVVSHVGYTDGNACLAWLDKETETYLEPKFETHRPVCACIFSQEKGALFFLQLPHYEDEFNFGLSRHTFNAQVDGVDRDDGVRFELEWFERTESNRHKWSQNPAYKLALSGYARSSRRRHTMITATLKELEGVCSKYSSRVGHPGIGEP